MPKSLDRKLKMGMIGGGPGAFIGDAHRKAALLDGQVDLVAGCFSQDPAKSKQQGAALYLDPARAYGSYPAMIEAELARPEGERIDFVSVVTPNSSHYPIASAFLKAGFHVVLDKPMTFTLAEAKQLQKLVKSRPKQVLALTHNYTGYPMVKLARDLVQAKKALGKVLKVVVQYPQGWLIQPIERQGAKQAVWRTDPKQSGKAGCMGDIGTHAENLAEYITGLRIVELCADLGTVVEGRPLDDDGNVLLRFDSGARGLLFASQISVGELNALRIHVYGETGSLTWRQEDPCYLHHATADGTVHTYRYGTGAVAALSEAAAKNSRLPFGHPEAFYEAFANIYRNACNTMRALMEGRKPSAIDLDFPDVDDGVRGMQFIESVVRSSARRKWIRWVA